MCYICYAISLCGSKAQPLVCGDDVLIIVESADEKRLLAQLMKLYSVKTTCHAGPIGLGLLLSEVPVSGDTIDFLSRDIFSDISGISCVRAAPKVFFGSTIQNSNGPQMTPSCYNEIIQTSMRATGISKILNFDDKLEQVNYKTFRKSKYVRDNKYEFNHDFHISSCAAHEANLINKYPDYPILRTQFFRVLKNQPTEMILLGRKILTQKDQMQKSRPKGKEVATNTQTTSRRRGRTRFVKKSSQRVVYIEKPVKKDKKKTRNGISKNSRVERYIMDTRRANRVFHHLHPVSFPVAATQITYTTTITPTSGGNFMLWVIPEAQGSGPWFARLWNDSTTNPDTPNYLVGPTTPITTLLTGESNRLVACNMVVTPTGSLTTSTGLLTLGMFSVLGNTTHLSNVTNYPSTANLMSQKRAIKFPVMNGNTPNSKKIIWVPQSGGENIGLESSFANNSVLGTFVLMGTGLSTSTTISIAIQCVVEYIPALADQWKTDIGIHGGNITDYNKYLDIVCQRNYPIIETALPGDINLSNEINADLNSMFSRMNVSLQDKTSAIRKTLRDEAKKSKNFLANLEPELDSVVAELERDDPEFTTTYADLVRDRIEAAANGAIYLDEFDSNLKTRGVDYFEKAKKWTNRVIDVVEAVHNPAEGIRRVLDMLHVPHNQKSIEDAPFAPDTLEDSAVTCQSPYGISLEFAYLRQYHRCARCQGACFCFNGGASN